MSQNSLNHEEVVEIVVNYAKANSHTRSLIALGSFARKDYHHYSDIDLALILEKDSSKNSISDELEDLFQKDLNFSLKTEPPYNLTLYLGEELLKLDLYLIEEFEEIEKYIWGSCTSNPINAILYDKLGWLEKKLMTLKPPNSVKTEIEIKNQINKFLYAFEAFSNAHRSSDGYRSYFEYNLALHRLVRIIYLMRGGRDFLFLPRKFVPDYLSPTEQNFFKQLNGKIYLRDVNSTKRRLLDFFYKILQELINKFTSHFNSMEIRRFCERIYERDYFWNLRDLSKYNPLIKKQRIYRSSTLSKYVDDAYFQTWLKKTRIKTIIDLQTDDEVVKRSYSREFLKRIEYFNIPLVPVVINTQKEDRQNTKKKSLANNYLWILQNRGEKIKEIFEILAKKNSYPIIIHCYGGKDRTGVLVSLIHLLLKTPKKNIIKDYLISEGDSRTEYIETILDYIESIGGIRKYFEIQKIDGQIQNNVINNLVKY